MKSVFFAGVLCAVLLAGAAFADPLITSWYTGGAGKYARVFLTTNDVANSTTYTTWSRGTTQAVPAYVGVQDVYSSTNWVYVRLSGLGAHTMGPWYVDAQKKNLFPNLPVNTKTLFKFPRTPSVPANKTLNGGGAIGYFVDGVSMFNSWDAFYWNGTTNVSGGGNGGAWNRDAYFNEGASFDPANAHQPGGGQYHYHANPPALRYELGDHVNFYASSNVYAEATSTPAHSPILGWVSDGYPVYGPYGYSNALVSTSTVIRMRSGYQLRNGQNGSDDLTTNATSRPNVPAWAFRLYGYTTTASSGPPANASQPLGTYMEDYAYLGDLTNSVTHTNYLQGTDFDLDVFNGRYCVTPEYPSGTYAYFVSIASNGTPTFPYNIGRAFYGAPSGTTATISEPVATNYLGGADAQPALNTPAIPSNVTITWSAVEGGTYLVESTTNFAAWTPVITNAPAVTNIGTATNAVASLNFYRVTRVAISNFDGYVGATALAPGGSASRGSSVTITITFGPTPGVPPIGNVPTSISLATNIPGSSITRDATNLVTATFAIPTNAPVGAQNVIVTFNPMPTYTLPGAFNIQ